MLFPYESMSGVEERLQRKPHAGRKRQKKEEMPIFEVGRY
jgi:hypothetical protein